MRKLLRTLLVLQLPIVVWLLLGAVHSNAIERQTAAANDKTPVGKQFFAPPSNQIAALATNEKLANNVLSVFSKTRGDKLSGWPAFTETIEQLLFVKSVTYLGAVVNIFRFGGTDIIYPFHFFW